MKKILHEVQENANFDPLFEQDLVAIKDQLIAWDNRYGNNTVSQYLFDVAFFRLVKHRGFRYANDLLTATRKALKRSVGSHSLTWHHRCKKQAIKAKTEELAQQNSVAA